MDKKITLKAVGRHTLRVEQDPTGKYNAGYELDTDDVQWHCPKCKSKWNEAAFPCSCGQESPYIIKQATSVTAHLDRIASDLEKIDPRLAMAIDKVSDKIEAAVTFRIDMEKHKKEKENYPITTHPVETIEQIKKKLEDPAIEKKVEDYIEKKHNAPKDLNITNIGVEHGTKSAVDDKSINLFFDFKFKDVGDTLDISFFKTHNIYWAGAIGAREYHTMVPVPLSEFEVED